MALHRDIHWIGRQWAVTGYGMQAIDQRHGSQFDIEIERLWEEDLPERLSGQKWFNPEDFAKGLAIARKRYPAPPRTLQPEPEPEFESEPEPEFEPEPAPAPLPPPAAPPVPDSIVVAPPPQVAEVLKPEALEPPPAPPKQVQAAAPEDLLAKWFEAYGLNKAPSSEPAPKPPRDVVAPAPAAKVPQPSEPIATVEPALTKESLIIESAGSQSPPSSNLQMPIPGSARFVRPWRVPIHSVQSYTL
jgi:hypothetical protein